MAGLGHASGCLPGYWKLRHGWGISALQKPWPHCPFPLERAGGGMVFFQLVELLAQVGKLTGASWSPG